MKYFETSAKEIENVRQVFIEMGRMILKKQKEQEDLINTERRTKLGAESGVSSGGCPC